MRQSVTKLREATRQIQASSALFELHTFTQFARGVLQQLAALLYAHRDAVIVQATGFAATRDNGDFKIVAATGGYSTYEGRLAHEVLDAEALAHIQRSLQHSGPLMADHHFAVQFITKSDIQHVVYLTSETRFSPADTRLVELFCRNVAIAFENIDLHQEIIDSQQQLILLLSSAIEERSKELRNHVKRVSEYSVTLGRLAGLADDELDALAVAAAMHDLGKIAVPDAILNKPGLYTADERAVMETHVERGRLMLDGQNARLLKMASIVVSEHHERWDGNGYPRRLSGEQIHIFGRVAAIADVFDALTTARCYKDPWALQKVVDYFDEQRGQHFDPALVDLFLGNLDQFLAIKMRLYGA